MKFKIIFIIIIYLFILLFLNLKTYSHIYDFCEKPKFYNSPIIYSFVEDYIIFINCNKSIYGLNINYREIKNKSKIYLPTFYIFE